jgi:polyisoprenoid-binding protein YceI
VARYRIVPEHSRVWIDARSSLHPIHSSSDGLNGYVDVEPSEDGGLHLGAQAGGRVSLPVARLSTGNRLEDRELQKRIDAKRFPTIDGVLTDIERIKNGRYLVRGDVTFRGVTRACEDVMTARIVDDRTIQVEGRSTFDIRDFGMEPPRLLMLRVEPEVVVRVTIVAQQEE